MAACAPTPPLQSLAALQAAGRELPLPFRLALPDGDTLLCTAALRLMPGKRLVLRATCHGKTVLAKLFFARRQLQQELEGFVLLQATGVPTPALLADHRLDDGGICLYEFIEPATTLADSWQHCRAAGKRDLLNQLLPLLQQCYQRQVLQQDLHPGNFLLHTPAGGRHTMYLLDPASCLRFTDTTGQQDNLALLLAQLPFIDWPLVLDCIGTHFPNSDRHSLAVRAQAYWQQRLRAYLKKIRRDCTEIADISRGKLRILCRRDLLDPALVQRLQDPASLAVDARVLKNGNSAKVFLLDIAGRPLVAKQYINKDWLRVLRRALRPSRAARSWHFAHALAFAGIHVPAPVALVEQKAGPLVTRAWYLCEYQPGLDLLTSWQQREPADGELEALQALFLLLQHSGISHGDMKASNLITNGEQLSLIDYDGTRAHRQQRRLQHALQRDKQRFLQNWNDRPALQQRLAELIDA